MQKLSLKNSPKTDHKSPAEIELAQIEQRLRTVQLALEILTGICATLPDPEPVAEGGDEDEENEGNDACLRLNAELTLYRRRREYGGR